MSSKHDYDSFHRMVADPTTSQNIIRSLNGCILFLPYDHRDDEIYLYDAPINVISYYALVLVSLTGLSTMLGMTETIDIQDFPKTGGIRVPITIGSADILSSISEPKVFVRDTVLEYVNNRIAQQYSNSNGESRTSDEQSTINLRRQFEYNFHLVGLNVIMLHFTSLDDPDVLHLVEVFRFRNPVLHGLIHQVLRALGLTLCCVTKFNRPDQKNKDL